MVPFPWIEARGWLSMDIIEIDVCWYLSIHEEESMPTRHQVVHGQLSMA